MADLSITATNVVKGANLPAGAICIKYALAAITAGQSLYLSTTDATKVGLHDSNAAAPANALFGVALNGGAIGQPIVVQSAGDIVIGATVVVGTIYLGSDTPGGIRPDADKTTGDTVNILGVGKNATTITLGISNTGITSA